MAVVLERLMKPPKDPEALADVVQLLCRLVRAYGAGGVAEMIGVHRAVVSRWVRPKSRPARIRADVARQIIDLHDVLNRALQVFDPTVVPDWLNGSDPSFHGARPIDVLRIRGAVPLIEALNRIAAGESA